MTEHEKPPLVSSFMQSHVRTLTPDMNLDQAAEFLLAHSLSSAPVVQHSPTGDLLIGFVSERDCLAALTQADFYGSPVPRHTVQTIMRQTPICVSPDSDLFSVTSLLINHGYRHVPVTDHGRLVGLVSRRDVLQAIVEYGKRYGQARLRERFHPDCRQLINLRYLAQELS